MHMHMGLQDVGRIHESEILKEADWIKTLPSFCRQLAQASTRLCVDQPLLMRVPRELCYGPGNSGIN